MPLTAYWGRCSESSLRRGHSEDVSPSNWNEFHQFFWLFFVTLLLARMFGIWFLIDFVLYSCVWSRAYVVAKPFCWRSHQWTSGEGWKKCFWLPTPTLPSVKRFVFSCAFGASTWRNPQHSSSGGFLFYWFEAPLVHESSRGSNSRNSQAKEVGTMPRLRYGYGWNCFLNHLKLAL